MDADCIPLVCEETLMKTQSLAFALMTTLALSGLAVAQETRSTGRFDDHDQQVTKEYYNQHKDNPPAGLRDRDRLSPAQESNLHEGAVLDRETRKQVHPAPPELTRQLPPPPSHHRYVAVGGHIGLIDNNYNVKAVIHLHGN